MILRTLNILIVLTGFLIGSLSHAGTMLIKNTPIVDREGNGIIEKGSASEDVCISRASTGKNIRVWPACSEMRVSNAGKDETSDRCLSLIRFDMDKYLIPPGDVVTSAKLRLYYRWSDPGTVWSGSIALYQCLQRWNPASATWLNRDAINKWNAPGARSVGKDRSAKPVAVAKVVSSPENPNYGWIEFNVTKVVRAWFTGEENYGFIIDVQDIMNGKSLSSSVAGGGNGTSEQRPELVIEHSAQTDNK
jgi:hypothetical protein